jgi:hypothetical protein
MDKVSIEEKFVWMIRGQVTSAEHLLWRSGWPVQPCAASWRTGVRGGCDTLDIHHKLVRNGLLLTINPECRAQALGRR